MNYNVESLFDLIKGNIPNGVHSYVSKKNDISLDFEIINYYDDVIFDVSPVLGNTVPDSQMLILKFHKNLTVSNGATLIPQVRKKGFFIFCKDTFINNGVISMTARGAIATGQDLYLYENEYIPATGGAAKAGARQGDITSSHTVAPGGNNGTSRRTGGGGPGAGRDAIGGNGAAGTSYSGGPGGGGGYARQNGLSGSANGGKGGDGKAGASYTYGSGGGAGNPGGAGISVGNPGGNGTGGLLILFGNIFINNGTISSNGTVGGSAYRAGGGGSGGGSINIFYEISYENKKTITVTGGASGIGTRGAEAGDGGVGGAGTLTTTKIKMTYHSNAIYQIVKDVILSNSLIKKIVGFN